MNQQSGDSGFAINWPDDNNTFTATAAADDDDDDLYS